MNNRISQSAVLATLFLPGIAAAQSTWTRIEAVHPTSGDAASAWDSIRGRVVAVVQLGTSTPMRTIEWDGADWTERTPTSVPPPRRSPVLSFDEARSETLLFSGRGIGTTLNDTWTWDGNTWQQRFPNTTPPARYGHRMVYDPIRQQVVMFGGISVSSSLELNDTWLWDGNDWRLATPTNSPSPRYDFGMAWDPTSQRTIVLSRRTARSNPFVPDTWAWDGIDWIQLNPATSPPAAFLTKMATDFARNRIVAFTAVTSAVFETWTWDGANWSLIPTSGEPHTPGTTALTYDGNTGGVLAAFGTSSFRGAFETEVFDGSDWNAVGAAPDPNVARLVTDEARSRVVMYTSRLRDNTGTWEWDGRRWQGLYVSPAPPNRLNAFGLAYDNARGVSVLFGGLATAGPQDDTWEWDGSSWTLRAPTNRPPARITLAMAYDPVRNQTVMLGRSDTGLQDTWVWDGSNWTEVFPSNSPPAFEGGSMVWDSGRQRLVLLGQRFSLTPRVQTWEWDGVDWSQVTTTNAPPLNGSLTKSLAYDRSRSVVVARDSSGDLWSYDGADWTLEQTLVARSFAGMTWDPTHGSLFGVEQQTGYVWLSSQTMVATTSRFGAGCSGSDGVPVLASFGLPGTARPKFGFDLVGARANAPAVLQIGLGTTASSIPFGSCTLLATTPTQFVAPFSATTATGFASIPIAIPNATTLLGSTFVAQGLVLDPNGAGLGLISTTNGVRATIGL